MYRVLIVDDEALIRNGLHKIIPWRALGFEVAGTAEDAERALHLLSREPVDVLLTDIRMPGASGLDLCAEAREMVPDLKTVIISGYNKFEYAVTALKLQADDYILKPLRPEEVQKAFQRLKQALDAERSAREERRRGEHVRSEYDMLRLIASDLGDEDGFRENVGRASYIRLILVGLSEEGDRRENEAFRRALREMTGSFYCVSTDKLFAVFLSSDDAGPFLDRLDAYCDKVPGLHYKVVISRDIYHSGDTYEAFLRAVERLERIENRQTVFHDRLGDPEEAYTSPSSLKRKMIRELEEGQTDHLEESVASLYMIYRTRSMSAARALCANVMDDLARYFRIADVSGLRLLSDQEPPRSPEELRDMVRADLAAILQKLRENRDGSTAVLVNRTKQMIDRSYADSGFSLGDIAASLNVNYNYLSTVFSKSEGVSPKGYLTSVRMEQARRLLLEQRYKTYQVAELVGYSSPRYFTDAFKKHFGTPPTEYIRSLGGRGDG